ncbi:hypothetical protein HKX48_009485 [Thoreauomyces humboldtii]|nr:hypothetical protein HKX48_009485 [Thoreauomyces humboldtii]
MTSHIGSAPTTPVPGHYPSVHAPPLALDSPDYHRAFMENCHFDEAISIHLETFTAGPPFSSISTTRLLDHTNPCSNDQTFEQDVQHWIASRPVGTEWKPVRLHHGLGCFPNVTHDGLATAGFRPSGTGHYITTDFSVPLTLPTAGSLSDAFTIRETTSSDVYFPKLIALQASLYPYPAAYLARLSRAMHYMSSIGTDVHHVAIDRETDEVAAEITVRYARGCAYLQSGGTAERYRRKGLCKWIFAVAVEEARRRGFGGMATVAHDERARLCWESCGFTTKGGEWTEWIKEKEDGSLSEATLGSPL